MESMSKKDKLTKLYRRMRRVQLPLKENATHLVFGEGSLNARLFFIFEAPGRIENQTCRPLVGSAGRELARLLAAINLDRAAVYITSILKYRPPDNRNPRTDEIQAHTPYLLEQIHIIKPSILIPLGQYATQFILSRFSKRTVASIPRISRCHGSWYDGMLDCEKVTVMPSYHPAALLYNRKLTGAMKKDFETLQKRAERDAG